MNKVEAYKTLRDTAIIAVNGTELTIEERAIAAYALGLTSDLVAALDLDEVYILWQIDANSSKEIPRFSGIYRSLEAARSDIPSDDLKLKGEPYGQFIEYYTYNLISKYTITK